jgi:L-seryl-tRNA(Ser) seleniumtransferase
MSPNEDTIGRASKVGKEEICGMLKALEIFVQSDQQAILKSYYGRLGHIATALKRIPGITTDYDYDPEEIANNTVRMAVSWDPGKIALTKQQLIQQLEATRPMSIRLADEDDAEKRSASSFPKIQITAWMLKPGQEKIVADRLLQIFRSGMKNA